MASNLRLGLTLLCGSAAIGACQFPFGDEAICARPGFHGVAVAVRDPIGRPAALGTTLIARDGTYADTAVGEYDSLTVGAADNRDGTYSLTVSRPWYHSVELQDVRVPGGPCGADETVVVGVTLPLMSTAPAVRNVVVIPPRAGLGREGLALQYFAYVDADPGIATSVTWHISDTTVAALSTTGLLTAKCRTNPGEAAVIATAVADTIISGVGYISVTTNAQSCS